MKIQNILKVAAVSGASAIALTAFGQGAAHADTFVKLPGVSRTFTMADGTVVHFSRSNESANINPSMGGTPLHRNAWVSGHFQVNLTGGAAKKAKGKFQAGYIVGCQLNLTGVTGNGGASGTMDSSGNVKPTATTGASVNIGPGQAANYVINDVEQADPFGNDQHKSYWKWTGAEASETYTNETMMVNGCAGYAQARSYTTIFVYTPTAEKVVTLYGQPFSLG